MREPLRIALALILMIPVILRDENTVIPLRIVKTTLQIFAGFGMNQLHPAIVFPVLVVGGHADHEIHLEPFTVDDLVSKKHHIL